jgi:hypothetical protein
VTPPRLPLLPFLLLLGAGGTACKDSLRTPCAGEGAEGDSTVCRDGQDCLWLNLGSESGYFCGTVCGPKSSCPAGLTCKTGGASGCMTCQDLIDVCE